MLPEDLSDRLSPNQESAVAETDQLREIRERPDLGVLENEENIVVDEGVINCVGIRKDGKEKGRPYPEAGRLSRVDHAWLDL